MTGESGADAETGASADGAAPTLSVVVALISGRVDDLRRCLRALDAQQAPFATEVLVPYDDVVAEVTSLATEFPEVTFIPSRGTRTILKIDGRVREHHDSLRTTGVRHARGEYVALTEDHAHVSEGWCREMVEALKRYGEAGAVGGAVDCDSDSGTNWAVYFCDFARYQSPVPEGPAAFVSDANVAYRRKDLTDLGVGTDREFHETIVHADLQRSGKDLVMTPKVHVWQARERLPFGPALRERFTWGKSYAGGRVHAIGLGARLFYMAFSPALSVLLTWRAGKHASQRGRTGRFLRVAPRVFLLHAMWALGELVGYVTGKP